ncbi:MULTISPECIES: GNAT family N-acetyltransferase [unclassified Paracoccus (in: a-proteobacteria)]|uniref:GNAT family N-acetyltransferase n=1 Tax=unclassified Paracoccus (in: a-proteobacteria) TaxID=2688777 RepID=UPI0015FF094D|nr:MULTISPECIES: GNAT family N-acetyltransferase [unclassified Paracoccus (in: a-proteobacteria)]MBB1490833.1 GNAT family N-acetyltransferase [Paracoccus sp. MC1854]MBB1497823.1 GNAT family N-acetyltransferase [Paracoccus sp. MC1862]QQO45297.1 GNAT family N-acetyltransferase [Paracoccus sp. MC1862]
MDQPELLTGNRTYGTATPDLAQSDAQAPIPAGRFILRPLRTSDSGLIQHYTADRRVAEGTRAIPHPLPPGAAEQYVARATAPNRTEDVWAIDAAASGLGELLGVVSLTRIEPDRSELGFWIGSGFWNTGVATEAVQALVAANPHRSRTLFAEAFQDNPGSAKVLTNAGFAYLGDAESWSVARNALVPTWTYLRQMR